MRRPIIETSTTTSARSRGWPRTPRASAAALLAIVLAGASAGAQEPSPPAAAAPAAPVGSPAATGAGAGAPMPPAVAPGDDVTLQLKALRKQVEELQARLEAGPQTADFQGLVTDLENFKYQQQRERETKTARSTRNLLVGGVVQTRAAWYSADLTTPVPADVAATSVNNPSFVKGRKLTFDVPTATLQFSGLLYRDYAEARNLGFSLSASASPSTSNAGQSLNTNAFLNVLDANVSYQLLPTIENDGDRLWVTFGQQLVPFGLEANTTEELRPVINNALFVAASNENGAGTKSGAGFNVRQIGLVLKGEFFSQYDFGYNYRQALVALALAAFNGTGPNRDDDNAAKDLSARVAITVPADYHSWLRELRFGASYYKGRANLTRSATDASGQTTTAFAGFGRRDRWGADVYYNHFPVGVTLEYVRLDDEVLTAGKRSTVTRDSRTVTVFYSFGEQFLNSIKNQAKYDDSWPKTFQPFVRYDRLDPDTTRPDDAVEIGTLGFNLFFAETTKAQLNVNRREQQEGAGHRRTSTEVLAQVQFGF
jgi:hypothetical protein